LLRRESIGRQRLDQLGIHVVVQPAVKQLNHVGSFTGWNGGGHFRAIVRIGKMRHRHGDVGICGLEVFDQLLHGRDASVEKVLPILDLNGLGG